MIVFLRSLITNKEEVPGDHGVAGCPENVKVHANRLTDYSTPGIIPSNFTDFFSFCHCQIHASPGVV